MLNPIHFITHILFCGMLFFCPLSQAQITIQSNDIMPFGMNYNIGITDDWNMTELIETNSIVSGQNKSWNFTNFTSILNRNLKIVSPSNAPYNSILSGNKVLLMDNGNVDSAYLEQTNDFLIDKGHVGGNGLKLPYLPGETLLKFPASYGQSHSGSYTSNTKFFVGAPVGTPFVVDSIRRNTTVNYDYVIDGWGTLQTPTGTFQVLKQNIYKTTFDSSDFLRQDTQQWIIGADVSTISERIILFWSNSQKYPVLQLRDIGDGGLINDVYWLLNPTLSNNDYALPSLLIYPNPADDELHINTNGNLKSIVSVFDLIGRKLISTESNQAEIIINIGSLSPGNYIISIEKDGKITSEKFTKK